MIKGMTDVTDSGHIGLPNSNPRLPRS